MRVDHLVARQTDHPGTAQIAHQKQVPRIDRHPEMRDPSAGLLNRKVVIVANLQPAKLMGVESNGMIVAASVDGKRVPATFTEEVSNRALLR